MKNLCCRVVLALAFSAAGPGAIVFAQQNVEPLTNDSVIKLVRAGFKEKTVIAIIHSRPNRFDLNAERLIELKHNGVNENVILAMIGQSETHFGPGDDWNDAAFFKNDTGVAPDKSREPAKPGAEIFGSGGSASGESRGRGQSSSNQGDSVTTGTATVRILRPPTEESGASVKLEKTPTLNNDSIIKLVDAGFSEGTIIKRIEDSPSEFDLSPPRLADLRKHRVSEPVISAMTLAMGDDPAARTTAPGKSREN